MTTRILLADDHQIIRDGLRSLLEGHRALQIVGEACDGQEAVKLAGQLKPDVVVMDLAMPVLNGVEATTKILKNNPSVKVIGLSMHSDVRFVSRMLHAGAKGYLLKDSAFEELIRAIRAVQAGQVYLSPKIGGALVGDYLNRTGAGPESKGLGLTDREREILQKLAEGNSTKEIAGALAVSVKTIETHRKNIMEKTGVHSIAQLTKFAIREGLTSLEP